MFAIFIASPGIQGRPANARDDLARVAGATVADASTSPPAASEYATLRSMGVDTAGFAVFWGIDKSQTTLAPTPQTVSDAALTQGIADAKAAGLRTVIQVMFRCPSCTTGWRGEVQPSDKAAFYESYRSMVNHYATIAEQSGVWLLFIGSEMNSTQADADDWREVARQARLRFHGLLAYEANFDVMSDVPFWDAVDVAGVSAYCGLSDAERPSVSELKAGWQSSRTQRFAGEKWANQIAAVARQSGHPVIFGEAGYVSRTHAAKEPFNYATDDPYDGDVQANAYQALLETFDAQPWWLGILWWDWHDTGPQDRSYSAKGKPAGDLLRRWYAEGWRPPGTPPPPAGVRRVTAVPATKSTAPSAQGRAIPKQQASPSSSVAPGSVATTSESFGEAASPDRAESGSRRRTPLTSRPSSRRREAVIALAGVLLAAPVAGLGAVAWRRRHMPTVIAPTPGGSQDRPLGARSRRSREAPLEPEGDSARDRIDVFP